MIRGEPNASQKDQHRAIDMTRFNTHALRGWRIRRRFIGTGGQPHPRLVVAGQVETLAAASIASVARAGLERLKSRTGSISINRRSSAGRRLRGQRRHEKCAGRPAAHPRPCRAILMMGSESTRKRRCDAIRPTDKASRLPGARIGRQRATAARLVHPAAMRASSWSAGTTGRSRENCRLRLIDGAKMRGSAASAAASLALARSASSGVGRRPHQDIVLRKCP